MDPMPLLLLNRARSEEDEPAPAPACCGGDDDAITRDDAMRRGARPTYTAQRGEAKREGEKKTHKTIRRRVRVGSALAFRSLFSVLRAALFYRLARCSVAFLVPGRPEEGGAGSRSRGKL